MVVVEKQIVSAEEYLTAERQALEKSEFLDGEIIPMAGATRNHNRVKENLAILVGASIDNTTCQSFSSDMRVHLPESGLYAYPDIVIVCGEPQLMPDQFDNLLNPTVLLEVMSEGTEDYDRGRKFHRYRGIPSLREYVLIDSLRVGVEVWVKNVQGQWTLVEETTDPAGQFTIQSIGLTVTLRQAYARTVELIP
ncbi:Uma2 family endonuclease [Rudanella paleaurantiibacter]|uniref:Uma2 family endonuclease n=1 Tax=Rudanella paleaurantiibacter TaxID=2614655 RepID=A0A7J5TXL1_9BACT|nr:Uma2 family endonuclease [Rudanella paleaurantiibacter]KAB7729382.1 Uma2 family endonuclease [Rudanella paleaurantiibacter]